MARGKGVPWSEDNVTMLKMVMEPETVTVPICLIELSPNIYRKLLRERNAVMMWTRSASVSVVDPDALAGAASSYPLVPVQNSTRWAASQTRPAKMASVVGWMVGMGQTMAVAAGAPVAGVNVTVRT